MPARRLLQLALSALVIYSAALLWIEATTSQEYVRQYFTDIGQPKKPGYFAAPTGNITFYAINTSLSAFFLACAGVLLIFATVAKPGRWSGQASLYAGQGAILMWMAADERFMLHEKIGAALHTRSTVILIAAVLINGALYAALFRASYFNLRMAGLFAAGVMTFLVMMFLDLLLPHNMPLRLSFEDLTKTWSGFAFLLFAWEAARFRLIGQAEGEKGLRIPYYLTSRVPRIWRSRLES